MIQMSAIPSPWPSSLVRSGGPWTLSSGSVFELSLPSSSSCNKPYFLGLRSRLWVCQRAKKSVEDRARRDPAPRHCNHRCRSRFCWKLDAVTATESLYILMSAMLPHSGDTLLETKSYYCNYRPRISHVLSGLSWTLLKTLTLFLTWIPHQRERTEQSLECLGLTLIRLDKSHYDVHVRAYRELRIVSSS